jgi:hypothetical protein
MPKNGANISPNLLRLKTNEVSLKNTQFRQGKNPQTGVLGKKCAT